LTFWCNCFFPVSAADLFFVIHNVHVFFHLCISVTYSCTVVFTVLVVCWQGCYWSQWSDKTRKVSKISFWTRYLLNYLIEFHQIYDFHLLGVYDEMNIFWIQRSMSQKVNIFRRRHTCWRFRLLSKTVYFFNCFYLIIFCYNFCVNSECNVFLNAR